ncbi:MAG: hypothetical protein ACOYK9_00285 [Chlamydiia bacterium]
MTCTMPVQVNTEYKEFEFSAPASLSKIDILFSLQNEKPRLAAKVGNVALAWIKHFKLIAEDNAVVSYVGSVFKAVDAGIAPFEFTASVSRLLQDLFKCELSLKLVASISKVTTGFRDTLKSIKHFSGSIDETLLGRAELAKSGADIASGLCELKGVMPNSFIPKLGIPTPEGTKKGLKISKNIATIATGAANIGYAIRNQTTPPLAALGLGTAALTCVLADHFISTHSQNKEASRFYGKFGNDTWAI